MDPYTISTMDSLDDIGIDECDPFLKETEPGLGKMAWAAHCADATVQARPKAGSQTEAAGNRAETRDR